MSPFKAHLNIRLSVAQLESLPVWIYSLLSSSDDCFWLEIGAGRTFLARGDGSGFRCPQSDYL
jgi:hypothetical protein